MQQPHDGRKGYIHVHTIVWTTNQKARARPTAPHSKAALLCTVCTDLLLIYCQLVKQNPLPYWSFKCEPAPFFHFERAYISIFYISRDMHNSTEYRAKRIEFHPLWEAHAYCRASCDIVMWVYNRESEKQAKMFFLSFFEGWMDGCVIERERERETFIASLSIFSGTKGILVVICVHVLNSSREKSKKRTNKTFLSF